MNKDLDKKYNGILKENEKLHNNLVETEYECHIIESKFNELMNNYNNIKVKNEKDEKEIEILNEEIEILTKEIKILNNKNNEDNIIISDYKYKIDNLIEK